MGNAMMPDQLPLAAKTATKDMTRLGLTLYCPDCTLAMVLGMDLKRHAKRCEACAQILKSRPTPLP